MMLAILSLSWATMMFKSDSPGGICMSDKKNKKTKNNRDDGLKRKGRVLPANFYGALKSKNEIYFQMASLFKEVTRDEKQLEHKWIDRIWTDISSDSSGNFFIKGI